MAWGDSLLVTFDPLQEYEAKLQEMETTLVKQLHTDRTEIMERLDLQRKVRNGGREGGRKRRDKAIYLWLLFRSMKTSWQTWRLPWPKVIVR